MGQKRDRNIYIVSKPSGAKVTYDGKFIGTTPTFLRFVEGGDTVGDHVLEIAMEGYIPYRRMFIDRHDYGTMSSDYPLKVVAHLEPLPSGLDRPSPTASLKPSLRLSSRPQKTEAIGQRWAVVVGISRYKHGGSDLANLRYADRDAKA
ncbi:MAG: PEGA domain-containing protein, partial [Aliifodinibius sp.]|nr:PEGA domain-containing protein [Fodinibius sp.]